MDIGTHKAQEVRLLGDPSLGFLLRTFWDLVRSHRGRPTALKDFLDIRRTRKELFELDFFYCLIEPVIYKEALKPLGRLGDFVFLRGVCSNKPSGPEVLRLARENLGHSIVPTKPNLSGRSIPTWNYNFLELLGWINANARRTDDDLLVLRMNAEGVEKDIIADLAAVGRSVHRVDAFFGSLGDIKKCFGEAALRQSQDSLREMGVPFFYFTSTPTSWASALRELLQLSQTGGQRADLEGESVLGSAILTATK